MNRKELIDLLQGGCIADLGGTVDEVETDALMIAASGKLEEAHEVIVNLLKTLPSVDCSSFHHSNGDQHGWNEECPPWERHKKRLAEAQKFISVR